MLTGVDLAKAVLNAKTRYTLLSLGSNGGPIFEGADGFLNKEDEEVRKCYTRIAARIHPDKLVHFPDATKAFQALVRAYELCCKPDLRGDESDDSREDDEEEEVEEDDEEEAEDDSEEDQPVVTKKSAVSASKKFADVATSQARARDAAKPTAASRSKSAKGRRAAGATGASSSSSRKLAPEHRTSVQCPRCHADWGSHLKGEGQEALYTSFMRGHAQVFCLTCLFEFGCNTATHRCPHCTRAFEYRPFVDFDKAALECPNDKQSGIRKACGKSFRVTRFAMSASKQADEERRRKQAEAERRQRESSKEARASRGGLAARYGDEEDEEEEAALLELGQFIVSEDCPRCGKQFSTGHAAHLKTCKGKKKGKGGGSGPSGGGSAVVKKRKRSGGGVGGFIVGSYDDDGDKAYREPKKAKTNSGSAAKAKAEKAEPAKKKPASAAKKPAAKKPAAKKPAAKKPRKQKYSDSDSDWDSDD